MFSLIVTLISIALVAALALATLYYGGPVFNQGAARAHAAKIAAQGQQLQGAAELYKADNGEYPISLAELVAQNYLKSIPVAAAQEQVLIHNALAASSWVMVAPRTPVFSLTGVSEATCKAVNLGAYGLDGILKTARQSNRVQCYGTSTGSLMIVQAKAPADLVSASTNPAAVIQLGAVSPAPVPAADSTDTSNDGWFIAPGKGGSIVTPPGVASLGYLSVDSTVLSSLDLGAALVGEPAAIKNLKIRNTSGVAVTFTAQGASVPAPFALASNSCAGVVLAPGAECALSVSFTPSSTQAFAGEAYSLTLLTTNATPAALPLSATSMPITVEMTEGGTARALGDTTPAEGVAFDATQGAAALSKTLTFRNVSAHPGAIHPQFFNYYLNTANSASYNFNLGMSATTCGTVMAPNATCDVTLTFSGSELSPNWAFNDGFNYSFLQVSPGVYTGAPPSIDGNTQVPWVKVHHKVSAVVVPPAAPDRYTMTYNPSGGGDGSIFITGATGDTPLLFPDYIYDEASIIYTYPGGDYVNNTYNNSSAEVRISGNTWYANSILDGVPYGTSSSSVFIYVTYIPGEITVNLPANPSGVWCFEVPSGGLHGYSYNYYNVEFNATNGACQ